jgi:hypothetical protein
LLANASADSPQKSRLSIVPTDRGLASSRVGAGAGRSPSPALFSGDGCESTACLATVALSSECEGDGDLGLAVSLGLGVLNLDELRLEYLIWYGLRLGNR